MKINKVFIFLFLLFIFSFLAFSSSIAGSPNLTAHFNSNGDFINGWYWLRDTALQNYTQWIFERIPSGDYDLVLDITALATDQASGLGGFPATFRLIFGFPGHERMGGVFQTAEITLPNVSSPDDPVGYTCHGLISIPRSFIPSATTFFFRIERISPNDNHIAFNQESIVLFTEEPASDYQETKRTSDKDK